jgi:redox-sensitive bicupin YhaK (pirin superfamily)
MAVSTPTLSSPPAFTGSVRQIARRTRGRGHGSITRLMSPSDFGQLLKPFVFLDLFDNHGKPAPQGMGLHPHSGIATLTYLAEGSVRYEDTSGGTGILPAGGVEWMRAGGGVWHGGGEGPSGRTRGFQLWIALPRELELAPSESVYQGPQDLAHDGPASVLLGSSGQAKSPIVAPSPINYFAVALEKGARWRYQPPAGHTVLWTAVGRGSVVVPEEIAEGELVAFAPGNEAVEFTALADAEFMVGSAAPHPHDLVLGYYSVHTSPDALAKGEAKIAAIQERLAEEGRL